MKANTKIALFVIACLVALSGGLAYNLQQEKKQNAVLAKQNRTLKSEALESEVRIGRLSAAVNYQSSINQRLADSLPWTKKVYSPEDFAGEDKEVFVRRN